MRKLTNFISLVWKSSHKIGAGSALLMLLATLPASAQEIGYSQQNSVPKFNLSVEKQEAMVRDEGAALARPVPDFSVLPGAGYSSTPVKVGGLPMGGTMTPRAQAIDNDRPNSYLEEYQVNWAPWVNDLAARWHGNLKATEASLGIQFHTPRAALIQFN
ncbi:MAG: hypothetical protein K2X81_07780 [Candidatus Obscuribacterales bacterium]|nr:hypothetical protein [Candidatus Obscuribacterales bacterium]